MDDASSNAGQIAFWNESGGERWARLQPQLDRAFAQLTAAFVESLALPEGSRVVDIGCGCGDLALRLAGTLGSSGRVLALDVSLPMLARARDRAAEETGQSRAPIDWCAADAADFSFRPDADIVVSRFGVMFFTDPVLAFRNIRRALKPGGRLALLCWAPLAQNAWAKTPLDAAVAAVGPPPAQPPDAPGPFAFADPARIDTILKQAGFIAPLARGVEADLLIGAGADADTAIDEATNFCLDVGPTAALLREADTSTRQAARAAILAALRPFYREGAVRLGAACWSYTARNYG